MKIVAVVGMCGSGKSHVCDYFVNNGFSKVYFGGVTMDELKKRNLEVNKDNEKMIREELRSKYGMSAYANILLPKIDSLYKSSNVVLDGLYSWDEYKILKDKFKDDLILVSIVVDKKIRYDRIRRRADRPLNSSDASKRDIAEIENLSKAGPISYADYYVLNNGSVDDLINRLEIIRKEVLC